MIPVEISRKSVKIVLGTWSLKENNPNFLMEFQDAFQRNYLPIFFRMVCIKKISIRF